MLCCAVLCLVQVDLSGLLPAEALAPFAEELAARERKRQQRTKQVGGRRAAGPAPSRARLS